jgi:hypothetical protein
LEDFWSAEGQGLEVVGSGGRRGFLSTFDEGLVFDRGPIRGIFRSDSRNGKVWDGLLLSKVRLARL